MKRNVKSGGEKTNWNGKAFEQKIIEYFLELISKNYKYSIMNDKYSCGKNGQNKLFEIKLKKSLKTIGFLGVQNSIFKYMKDVNNWLPKDILDIPHNPKDVWSKNLIPDIFLFNLSEKCITIFEVKYQKSKGSVDEKLQTALFKRDEWSLFFKQYGIKVNFEYILGPNIFWTQKAKYKTNQPQRYRNIFKWLEKNKIKFSIENKNESFDINIYEYLE